ncbi:MAG TPA: ATP--guanido phosphotransferase [Spirochaetota bacterium]|nr:ATP--guanido phosphotransferase [Spirochaetota bacterium]HPC42426.1 ATP--guanido phosphotransferase [Spirochaetota bacterium]HPL16690.1 ATP--guanido phosphotransferase [Spirochaetota bacterium]HQF06587.1 ATP--guanido phosphotransferase [Spirochaetota bacterium]HQH96010.1 ATP--guanido phosphotransferase [Spirochaetota bacterium]
MFEEVLQKSAFWTSTGPFSHIVLSSRLRLARNMQSVPFPGRMTADDSYPIRGAIERFAAESRYRGHISVIDLRDIDANEKRFLRERNIITYEMEVADNTLVVVNNSDDFSILVNEEDHFRIQVIRPGLQLMDVYKTADAVDSELNRFVPYAFSEELGFLTACTSNLGTGLRVSVLLHLPVITMKNGVQELIPEDRRNTIEIKGTIGKSSKTLGCLYQLSNRVSLGPSEVDIIESVDEVIGRILEKEDNRRDEYYTESRTELEDMVWRSYGILRYSRRISYIEAMDHLSNVRLGIVLAIIKNMDVKTVNDIMVNIQWAHLQRHYALLFKSTGECDEYRADYMRKLFQSSEVK